MDPQALEGVVLLAEQDRWTELRAAIADWSSHDLADLVEALDERQAAILLRDLPDERASTVFAHLAPDQQAELLELLTDSETRAILVELEPDDRTAVLEDLPSDVQGRLIDLLPDDEVEEARDLLGYPDESVGRLMTPDLIQVLADMDLSQVLEHIRAVGDDSETLSRIYVTDVDDTLLGSVRLRHVILGDPKTPVVQVMDPDCTRLLAEADREDAVRLMQRADVAVLPVVDHAGRLVGIVTADDVFDVAEEETTEDMHMSAAVSPLATSYRRAQVGLLYRRRVGWLGSLIFVSLASSFVIAGFETTLEATIGLAFFIPILMAAGGNVGSQSSMLMMRALATDEVRMDEWARSFGKELAVGLALGVTLGLLAGLVGIVQSGMDIAWIVGITMTGVVVVANLLGMSLPFLLQKVGVDPAVASAPLITSIVDAVGLLIYFSVATVVLG